MTSTIFKLRANIDQSHFTATKSLSQLGRGEGFELVTTIQVCLSEMLYFVRAASRNGLNASHQRDNLRAR